MTSTGILEKRAINHSIERWAAGLVADMKPSQALTIDRDPRSLAPLGFDAKQVIRVLQT